MGRALGSPGTWQGGGCWGSPGRSQQAAGIIQVLWEGGLGAQRCRRHSSRLETPHLPGLIPAGARRGALGSSRGSQITAPGVCAARGSPGRDQEWSAAQPPHPQRDGQQAAALPAAAPASGARRGATGPGDAWSIPTQDGPGRGEGDPSAARGRPCRDWCWPHHGCKDQPQHSATAHGTRRGSDPPIR